MQVEVIDVRGWSVLRLRSPTLQADILPGKGGDVLSLRWLPRGVELLWRTPWGLRRNGAAPLGADSAARLMAAYPGGWQTVFPNGGDAVTEHGVEWGMHGEVWLTPFEWEHADGAVSLAARLVQSPFRVHKRVELAGNRITVTEQITNESREPVEVMWSQHPAFGMPLLGPDAVLSTNAASVVADDVRDMPSGDLLPGARGRWPYLPLRDGAADLSTIPASDAHLDRLVYLTDFDGEPWARLANPRLGLQVSVTWTADPFAYAWYWLEACGTTGFPWYGSSYVLAIEPASSYPGQGLHAARAKTGTQLEVAPGETRTGSVTVTVEKAGS